MFIMSTRLRRNHTLRTSATVSRLLAASRAPSPPSARLPASGERCEDQRLCRAATSIRSSVSNRSDSAGSLSQRKRLMRGNRMASPDLWRGERCSPSNATSSTRPRSGWCTTSRTGPKRLIVFRRTKRSIRRSSFVGETEIGLADRHQLAAVGTPAPNPKCVIRIE
jgi:hypothetical protein